MSGKVARESIDLGFATMKLDISKDSIAVGLFGAIGVMVVAQHLADLVHQFQFWIRLEFGRAFDFHSISF